MVEEIKFRQAIGDSNGKFTRWHYWGYLDGISCDMPMGPVEWDKRESYQFTGLKDKNGKEIYEGDIVDSDPFLEECSYKAEVVWHDYGWFLHFAPNEFEPLNDFENEGEVISNIYENKELLKELLEVKV